jgi:multiple sugar transport system substrate-binding protein
MMRLRHFFILLIVLTACSNPRAEVAFFSYGDSSERAAYEALVASFNRKHPEIQVTIGHTPGEDEFRSPRQRDAYRQRLIANVVSGTTPDVFMIPYREYAWFLNRAVIEPIAPLLAKSAVIREADFYPQALTPFRDASGALVCLPQNASTLVLYYNKTLFDAARLPYPTADWTWGDLLNAAQKLTTDTNNPQKAHYGLGLDADITRLLPFLWQHGAQLVDDDGTPTRFTLDTPAAQAALQQFTDLQNRYRVVPDENAALTYPPSDRFITGSIGMLVFSRRITPILRTVQFDWDVAPLPRLPGQPPATLLFADGFCLSRSSKHKDAAWKLIEYAMSPEGQTLLAKAGRNVPSLRAVAESPAFLDPAMKPASSRVFLDTLPDARLAPYSVTWADVEEELNRQIQAGFYEGLSPPETAARINRFAAPLMGTPVDKTATPAGSPP